MHILEVAILERCDSDLPKALWLDANVRDVFRPVAVAMGRDLDKQLARLDPVDTDGASEECKKSLGRMQIFECYGTLMQLIAQIGSLGDG